MGQRRPLGACSQNFGGFWAIWEDCGKVDRTDLSYVLLKILGENCHALTYIIDIGQNYELSLFDPILQVKYG